MRRTDRESSAPERTTERGREPSSVDIERVYDALRAIARRERLRNPSRTLDTTVLIHEAWLKLGGREAWMDDRHCLASYAVAIRQVLIDYIRHRCAEKRIPSDDYIRFHFDQLGEHSAEELLEIDRALNRMEQLDPRLARLVELRFFAGLSAREAAEALEISERTATRDWAKARAFLQLARHEGD